MTALLLLTALFAGFLFGVVAGRRRERRMRPGRERALSLEIRALEAALDVTHDAWMAKASMHEQARQIRRGHP